MGFQFTVSRDAVHHSRGILVVWDWGVSKQLFTLCLQEPEVAVHTVSAGAWGSGSHCVFSSLRRLYTPCLFTLCLQESEAAVHTVCAGVWGGWSHCVCCQKAEQSLLVYKRVSYVCASSKFLQPHSLLCHLHLCWCQSLTHMHSIAIKYF